MTTPSRAGGLLAFALGFLLGVPGELYALNVGLPYLMRHGYPEIWSDWDFWRTCKAAPGLTEAEARAAMSAYLEPEGPTRPHPNIYSSPWAIKAIEDARAAGPGADALVFEPIPRTPSEGCVLYLQDGVVQRVRVVYE